MVVGGSKESQMVLFLVILQIPKTYLQFYFKVKVTCKLAFEERACKIIVNKFVSFLLDLKLDFSSQIVCETTNVFEISKPYIDSVFIS